MQLRMFLEGGQLGRPADLMNEGDSGRGANDTVKLAGGFSGTEYATMAVHPSPGFTKPSSFELTLRHLESKAKYSCLGMFAPWYQPTLSPEAARKMDGGRSSKCIASV